jgi:regulator of replication initiation timing
MTIECLKEVINSLEEDNKALREEAYKTAKRPRKTAIKETTDKKPVAKKTAAKKTTKK